MQFWKFLLYSLTQHQHLSTSFVLPHLCASTAALCLHVQTLTSSLPPWAFRLTVNQNHFKAKIRCRPLWGGVVFLEPVLRECNLWHKQVGVYQAVTRTRVLCIPVAPAAIIGTMGQICIWEIDSESMEKPGKEIDMSILILFFLQLSSPHSHSWMPGPEHPFPLSVPLAALLQFPSLQECVTSQSGDRPGIFNSPFQFLWNIYL